ncbi:unnamed protein product [Cuscuta epithymum]|uniref:Retrotransposon gag domain-containing protein n=1 Tax=Cuscuta epithymum TaxID=186058 RepID=A0AAV0D3K8_9ASTE|nr:unnamed protein product [Cuscuta epithymum]CAH9125020.1 unnamed protein product [Cuscuta epithymum]
MASAAATTTTASAGLGVPSSTIGAPVIPGSQPFSTSSIGTPVLMPSSAAIASSSFASPSRSTAPFSLFQTLPPVFSWSPPSPVQSVSLEPPPQFTALPQVSIPASVQFSGPTFVGSPGISSSGTAARPASTSSSFSPMADLAQTVSHVATNVTNIVTTKLQAVEDYTTWRTQFESFLVSQNLLGMVDGSVQVPSVYSIDLSNRPIPNPEYSSWLRIDQTIRSWLFATLSRDVLIDVRDLKHSFGIWERLESRFMSASLARSMELKHMLNTIRKKPEQSMDSYLREIKILVDDLACINCPVSQLDMLKAIIIGLGKDYASMINTITLFPQHFPFETLPNHLIEIEQRDKYFNQQEASITHQVFAVQNQPHQV